MAHTSEYEVEDIFIDRLEGIVYKFIKLDNYDDVLANFREQLAKFNAKKLQKKDMMHHFQMLSSTAL